MRRLILFSGGVESTALLALKSPDDIAVTVEDISPRNQTQTFNELAVTNIANELNVDVHRLKYSVPYPDQYVPHYHDEHWYHQLWTFLPMVSIYLTKERFSEVWVGTSLDDDDAPHRERKRYVRLLAGWNALHPDVPIALPLNHLTTPRIWDNIPRGLRPLVRNCFRNTIPGRELRRVSEVCEAQIATGECFRRQIMLDRMPNIL